MADLARPIVSFVGAGPGDAELITMRGLARLRAADVVIHDRLVSPELFVEARPDAELIDVGKAPGRHGLGQEQINALIVDRARRRPRVVRLKGGDPSIFGRLAEEIAAVRSAGLAFEIVPGVTAASSAAALAGISLTERGQSSMVAFASGTDHAGRPPALDWTVLSDAGNTAVFYMAVRHLESITANLIAFGRDPREPALIVERAASDDARVVSGRLGTTAAAAREAGIEAPAVLIVGPTVRAASLPLPARRALVEAED